MQMLQACAIALDIKQVRVKCQAYYSVRPETKSLELFSLSALVFAKTQQATLSIFSLLRARIGLTLVRQYILLEVLMLMALRSPRCFLKTQEPRRKFRRHNNNRHRRLCLMLRREVGTKLYIPTHRPKQSRRPNSQVQDIYL